MKLEKEAVIGMGEERSEVVSVSKNVVPAKTGGARPKTGSLCVCPRCIGCSDLPDDILISKGVPCARSLRPSYRSGSRDLHGRAHIVTISRHTGVVQSVMAPYASHRSPATISRRGQRS